MNILRINNIYRRSEEVLLLWESFIPVYTGQIMSILDKELTNISTGGSILPSTENLAKIQLLNKEFITNDYKEKAREFISLFPFCNSEMIEFYKKSEAGIKAKELESLLSSYIEFVSDFFAGVSYSGSIVAPIKQSVISQIMFGMSVQDLLDKIAIELPVLLKNYYVNIIDIFYQYAGMINQKAVNNSLFEEWTYLGNAFTSNDIETPQDTRWSEETYSMSEIQQEIDWMLLNGTMVNTEVTVSNFFIYRGGKSCRNLAVPVF